MPRTRVAKGDLASSKGPSSSSKEVIDRSKSSKQYPEMDPVTAGSSKIEVDDTKSKKIPTKVCGELTQNSKKKTNAQLMQKVAELEKQLKSKVLEEPAIQLVHSDEEDEVVTQVEIKTSDSEDEVMGPSNTKRRRTDIDSSDAESEVSEIIPTPAMNAKKLATGKSTLSIDSAQLGRTSTKMSRCNDDLVQPSTSTGKTSCSDVQLMSKVTLLDNKPYLKEAFSGKTGPFVLYVIAKRKTFERTVMLVRDSKYLTTDCELARKVEQQLTNFRSGLVRVTGHTTRPGPNGTIVVIQGCEVLLEHELLQETVDRRFGEATCLVVGSASVKKVTIFELELDMKGIELNVEILSQRNKPWTNGGREGNGLFFTCKDVTGTMQGAIFAQVDDFAEKFQNGAKLCIKNPLIKLADSTYNSGFTSAYELRFNKDTTVNNSNFNFRVERI